MFLRVPKLCIPFKRRGRKRVVRYFSSLGCKSLSFHIDLKYSAYPTLSL